MQRAPDQSHGFPIWTIVGLILAATVGGVLLIVRSGPDTTATSSPPPSREACQPASPAPSPSALQTAATTPDWAITVNSAKAESAVAAQDGGTYMAAPGEVFIVVAVSFRNLHPGTESSLSTSLVKLECSDGTQRPMVGFDDGKGFCRVCGLDFGTEQRRVRWTFIFRMDRTFLEQPFRFRYDTAQPIDLALAS
jgi:hypothetical protein